MKKITVKSSGIDYSVTVLPNPDNKNPRSTGFKKGKETVVIYHPTHKVDKGWLYWGVQKQFENPVNDYQRIFNYVKENIING